MTAFNFILFDNYETFEVSGSLEIMSKMPKTYRLGYYSMNGGIITNSHMVREDTEPFSAMDASGVLSLPGGPGVRQLVDDEAFLEQLKGLAQKAQVVFTVSLGSALLAKTGLLDGVNATSDRSAFRWACSQREGVRWVRRRPWLTDGKFHTSQDADSAMDMTFSFVRNLYGEMAVLTVARGIEYTCNEDSSKDVRSENEGHMV